MPLFYTKHINYFNRPAYGYEYKPKFLDEDSETLKLFESNLLVHNRRLLNEDIFNWLEETISEWKPWSDPAAKWVCSETPPYFLGFSNEEDLILFKMRWI